MRRGRLQGPLHTGLRDGSSKDRLSQGVRQPEGKNAAETVRTKWAGESDVFLSHHRVSLCRHKRKVGSADSLRYLIDCPERVRAPAHPGLKLVEKAVDGSKQHIHFAGEVVEEGGSRDSRPPRNVIDRGVRVAPLEKELGGSFFELFWTHCPGTAPHRVVTPYTQSRIVRRSLIKRVVPILEGSP